MSKKASAACGTGFPLASILTTIFVLAKLFGAISWSWWWVFAPLWISSAITVAVLVIALVCWLLIETLS